MLDVTFLLSAFVTLLVTIGPFETAPVFAGLARHLSPDERKRTVRRAVVISGLVLVAFALVGKGLLGLLHVTLPALRTAGGVLLFLEAIHLMFTAPPGMSTLNKAEQEEAARPHDISVFPLAFPLIAGPGSLLAVVLLMSQANGDPWHIAGVLGVLAVCLLLTWGSLASAETLTRLLGVTGSDVIGRISGLLLAALAMQYVFDGLNGGLLKHFS
jgi:multiple antibiotic resistance protein